ncbi:MAG TPA: bifunctional riboflavin kinase/FAD synthetase [Gemmatimonadales bacterium]|nr:bifunctional riboflavin kinase/FAD synthetase [Gemmatimonadales bacterium]
MNKTVVTVGSFDGVHRGHQAVLAEIARRAKEAGRTSLLVTFDPHPLEVVNPDAAPKLLTTPDEKQEVLNGSPVDEVVVLPFTRELSQLSAPEFVDGVLRERYGMVDLVLGYDHGFGRGRSGDVETVRRLGQDKGFTVDVVDAVRDDGQPISSTVIRTAVAHGELDRAERWLGRPYAFSGVVEQGAGRGRTIGIPTINLTPPARKLLPPDGVYAVHVTAGGRQYGGMMNQGARPTFGVTARGLETHVFDFAGDLYGERVRVEWVRRLRDVRTFPSREALMAQLDHDRAAARECLNLSGTR